MIDYRSYVVGYAKAIAVTEILNGHGRSGVDSETQVREYINKMEKIHGEKPITEEEFEELKKSVIGAMRNSMGIDP